MNFPLFFEAAWLGFTGYFSHMNSPLIVVCARCKKVLHANPKATAVSHGLCWLDFYKDCGGTFPAIPKLSDFAIVKAFRRDKPHPTKDAGWTTQALDDGLIKNGEYIEAARLERRSLDERERAIILAVRGVALDMGMSKTSINATEMRGERIKYEPIDY